MRMAYPVRILVGAVFGFVALAALALLVGVTWITATVAALAAPLGFLGSYFIWSADRPEEGYEQVLFDKPNTIVTSVMILMFALAGVGSGFLALGGGPAAPPDPGESTLALHADYQDAADAYTTGRSTPAETMTRLGALDDRSFELAEALEKLPEGDARTNLITANDAISIAITTLRGCATIQELNCLDARVAASDASAAIGRYSAG